MASTQRQRKTVVAGVIGTTVEFYDFAIYGTAAALIFGPQFFSESSAVAGTLAAFATFAAGFVARPLGGFVFGHFGDRVGRKRTLQITLLLMGLSTTLIGLLPTYAQVGLLAPLLLVLLRLAQGFAAGGEIGGAVVMVVENTRPERRATSGSMVIASLSLGGILATGVFFLVSSVLTTDQFNDWGWRIPFLISIVLVGVGAYVRSRLDETTQFAQVAERGETERFPLLTVLRHNMRSVLFVLGVATVFSAASFLLAVFVLNYLSTTVGLTQGFALGVVTLALAVSVVSAVAAGRAADSFGRRRVIVVGLVTVIVATYPLFALMDTADRPLVVVGVLGLGTLVGAIGGPMATYFSELFPPSVRYSGFSVGYQLASILGGGLAPFIATALLAATGGAGWSISLYIVALAVVALACIASRPDAGGPRAGLEGVSEKGQEEGAR